MLLQQPCFHATLNSSISFHPTVILTMIHGSSAISGAIHSRTTRSASTTVGETWYGTQPTMITWIARGREKRTPAKLYRTEPITMKRSSVINVIQDLLNC